MYDLLVISLFCNFQDNFEDAETKKRKKPLNPNKDKLKRKHMMKTSTNVTKSHLFDGKILIHHSTDVCNCL